MGLLRISEASALQVSDVEATADGGAVTIRASKTDQMGDGAVRFLGAPTVAAVQRYLEAAGITDGPLFKADTQGRPGHRRCTGRRLAPGDRPPARGGRSPTTPAVYVRRESATRGPVARRRYGVGQ